jgi:hypothetical protein
MSTSLDCAGSARRAVTVLLVGALLGLGSTTVPAETLLVVRKSAGAVDFVDPGSGFTLSSVAVGLAPHEISRSPDGRFAAVSNYGTREEPGATLSILDLEHPRELRRIELGAWRRPHGVVWFEQDRIAVTTEEPAALLIVDPRAARVIVQVPTEQAGSHMVAVISHPLHAFVTNRIAGTTTVIDLASSRKLADVPTGAGSEAIAVTRDWSRGLGGGARGRYDHGARRANEWSACHPHGAGPTHPYRDDTDRYRARELCGIGRGRRVRGAKPPADGARNARRPAPGGFRRACGSRVRNRRGAGRYLDCR